MGHVDRALRKGKGDASGASDGKQEGTGSKEEKKKAEERTNQAEGNSGIGTSSHAEHMPGKSVPADCEECAQAMKEEEKTQ